MYPKVTRDAVRSKKIYFWNILWNIIPVAYQKKLSWLYFLNVKLKFAMGENGGVWGPYKQKMVIN